MDPLSWTHIFTLLEDNISASEPSVGGSVFAALIMIVICSIFTAGETAVMNLNDARIEELAEGGNKKARIIHSITEEPSSFQAKNRTGVSLSGFLAFACLISPLANVFASLLKNSGLDSEDLTILSVLIATLILTFLILLLGVFLPRRLVMKNREKNAFTLLPVIQFLGALVSPLSFLVGKTADLIARLFGIKASDLEQEYTEEEIRSMIEDADEKGFIETDEREMINNVFEFNDRTVSEIMTHRVDMDMVDEDETADEVLTRFRDSGHSRMPVYEGTIDNIVGVLYVKDLINLFMDEEKKKNFRIRDYMRTPLFVYENMKCDDLLTRFQKEKVQVAIVLDEYGGTYGLVSMEDLLESIVGNIQDEFDHEEEEIEKVKENDYIVDGATPIEDVSRLISQELNDEDNDTIGGLLIDHLGYIPEENDHPSVKIGNASFTILSMDERSIGKIEIIITPYEEE